MRKITRIEDVVGWGLCTGCGACLSACGKNGVTLRHVDDVGVLPVFDPAKCSGCTDCLFVCPGRKIESDLFRREEGIFAEENHLIGPYLEIWEGYATDPEIRHRASSGGVLTALALYCLEREGMQSILHTGMDPGFPWRNITVRSGSKAELLERAGSRYSPSSPCEGLRAIEGSGGECVFIGKPCDTAAAVALRRERPLLKKKLGLVLTFFCAGPPCSKGTLSLIDRLGVPREQVRDIRYRGLGWPGRFTVSYDAGRQQKSLTYKESWGALAKHPRAFRCHLCPDGLGEIADISCGDAWYKHTENGDPGLSLVIVRSKRGAEVLHKAIEAGYLDLVKSGPGNVIASQGLIKRRQIVFGRLLAMRFLLVPAPIFHGFPLYQAWREIPAFSKAKTVLGTLKRILFRGLWHKAPAVCPE